MANDWAEPFVRDEIFEQMGQINVKRSKYTPPGQQTKWLTITRLFQDHSTEFIDVINRLEKGTVSKKNAKKELRAIFEVLDAAA